MVYLHRRLIWATFVAASLQVVIFIWMGNAWYSQDQRGLRAVDKMLHWDMDSASYFGTKPTGLVEVDVHDTPPRAVIMKTKFAESSFNDPIVNPMTQTALLIDTQTTDVRVEPEVYDPVVRLPPDYLLDKPFYVYEEFVWLDAKVGNETIEEMIGRGYLWKHNDDLWWLNAALKHPMRTYDPEKAVLFIVPSLINMFLSVGEHGLLCYNDLCGIEAIMNMDRVLGQSPWFQKNQGKDHVLVASLYSASMRLALFPNLVKCNMIAHENRKWNHEDRYSVSSYYVGSPCLPRPKQYDFAMIATLKRTPTFESRWNICEWLGKERPQYSVSRCGEGEQCPALAQARFGFHVRGDTYGANRLMDTILSGTIPIFTMKEQYDILPDWIRWDDISYFADVSNKETFLQRIDEIMRDEALYQQKFANLMVNRDLFDWQTHVPFDTYMYMILAQLYPHYRKDNAESPYSALQLSKPGGFETFDSNKKQVWCGNSGPAKHCGECAPLQGSLIRGCQRMCKWCEYGYIKPFETDFLEVPAACVPSHYECKEPDVETVIESAARPYHQISSDLNWCVEENPDDDRVRGLLLAKTYNTGSSTAAAVTIQIANRVGKRKGLSRCLSHENHELSVFNIAPLRDELSSVVWTIVRNPADRALSSFAVYQGYRINTDDVDNFLMEFLFGAKNNQIAQLRTDRGMSALGGQPTNPQSIPASRSQASVVIKGEINSLYDFIAVAERMDESLVVMKLLWGLEDADIIVASVKESEGWSYSSGEPEECIFVPRINVSRRVQQFIDTEFAEDNADYILHAVANKSLDLTIESLGRERVQLELERHLRLKSAAVYHCRKEIIVPCSARGEWQPEYTENCYVGGIGCGHKCINHFLDQYEAGKILLNFSIPISDK